jgi:hypothetical protein
MPTLLEAAQLSTDHLGGKRHTMQKFEVHEKPMAANVPAAAAIGGTAHRSQQQVLGSCRPDSALLHHGRFRVTYCS